MNKKHTKRRPSAKKAAAKKDTDPKARKRGTLSGGCHGPFIENPPACELAKGDELNASEALFAFCGWLTSRQKPVILSAKHDAAVVVELIKAFEVKQALSPCRPDWDKRVKPMADIATDLTNDPTLNPDMAAPPRPTFEQGRAQLEKLLLAFPDRFRNHLLAVGIELVKQERTIQISLLQEDQKRRDERFDMLMDGSRELQNILSGNFSTVPL